MKGKIAVTAALCALLEMILAPQQMIDSARYALRLCAELIIPSLFPFFVVSGLLNRLGFSARLAGRLSRPAARLYGISGAGATALFMGLIGGYPLGAAYIADMRRQGLISAEEGERLMGFCNNSGPAFLIGSIGAGVFGSARLGLGLYIIHILSALITGLFFRGSGRYKAQLPHLPESRGSALIDSVRQAAQSILSVCGFIVCFCVIIGLMDAGGYFSLFAGRLAALTGLELHAARALLSGVLELGSGIGAMRGLSPSPVNLAIAAGIVGWGGLSVHFQTYAVLAESDIKGDLHLTGRLICCAVSSALGYIFGLFFT